MEMFVLIKPLICTLQGEAHPPCRHFRLPHPSFSYSLSVSVPWDNTTEEDGDFAFEGLIALEEGKRPINR